MLEFEHIIQINDSGNPHFPALSREQLWQGLLLRAKYPEKFNPALSCRTEEVSPLRFHRFVRAGESEFCELVALDPLMSVHTHTVDSQPYHAESTAVIEEPEAGSLFIRFSYKRELPADDEQLAVGEHLKSAYLQVDRDAVAMIRMLVQQDSLDQSVN